MGGQSHRESSARVSVRASRAARVDRGRPGAGVGVVRGPRRGGLGAVAVLTDDGSWPFPRVAPSTSQAGRESVYYIYYYPTSSTGEL